MKSLVLLKSQDICINFLLHINENKKCTSVYSYSYIFFRYIVGQIKKIGQEHDTTLEILKCSVHIYFC